MEPRVTKREKKLHLSYELPHRIHAAQLYPIPAPNGSSVVIYGHDRGIRILWRGGRKREEAAPSTNSQPNGTTKRNEVVVMDDDDEVTQSQQAEQNSLFAGDEEELDPDCPFPNFVQDVDVDLETQVLQVTVPSIPTASFRRGDALSRHGAIAISCSDGSQRVLAFDLLPPTNKEKPDWNFSKEIPFPSSGTPCSSIAAKIIPADRSRAIQATNSFLLVAAASDTLHVYRFSLFDEPTNFENSARGKVVQLPHRAVNVSLHPSASSSELLVSDVSGAVRTFDPFAFKAESGQPDESALDTEVEVDQLGRWLISFTTSFVSKDGAPARRKQVLETKWILSGKAILVLLEDGEWGVWDLAVTGKNVSDFALHGHLGATAAADSTQLARQTKSISRLAPMTPNTRKAKAENLFGGAPKNTGAAAKGGISVSPSSSKTGQTDEGVVMWYGSDIYIIPSLQTFWQRSTSNAKSSAFGSLYTPGLTHITDVNLINEAITSIAQFAPTAASSGVGQMNTPRDLLVSAEHRLIILQTLRPPAPARGLFQQAAAEQRPVSRDQRMLDVGQLDIGGMDRLLDSMANGDARPRRVGFATY